MRARFLFSSALLAIAVSAPCRGQTNPGGGTETIVFIRHGEKPPEGLGQLDCQGLNRALALPSVFAAKFGKPTAVFAPNPSNQKADGGKLYDYVRPLATVEPTAIRFGLPVDTSLGFADADKLKLALEQPALHDATVLVAWEHNIIDGVASALLAAHGGGDTVPKWKKTDFDGIYVVRIAWNDTAPKATFQRDRQGLDGVATTCPN